MSDIKRILSQMENEETASTPEFFELVYHELRQMASSLLAHEPEGHTLQTTALVHEAYFRLLGPGEVSWNSRRHFFGAAAQAMRRILVDNARRKASQKAGGDLQRRELDETLLITDDEPDLQLDLLDLDEALDELAASHPTAAELVRLRFFGGLKMEQAVQLLGISSRSGYYTWAYARSWLSHRLRKA